MLLNHILIASSFYICFAYHEVTTESTSDTFNFIMHGDWGWNSFNQTLTSYEMSVYAWIINAEFLIALGDNFYADGVTGTDDTLWDTAFHDVYTAPSLNIPWYGILGNHDYHGNVQAQVARTKTSGETMWTMPSTYYIKHYEVPGGAIMTILYIDTCLLDPYQKDTDAILSDVDWEYHRSEHLKWIDNKLALFSETSQWLIVAGHYPIYSIGEHGDDQYLVDDLLPLLLKYKVHAYLNGHDHLHQHIYKDGLHHITSGNSAGRGPFFPQQLQYLGVSAATNQVKHYYLHCGFAFAEVDSTEFVVTFMDNFGVQRYDVSLGEPMNLDKLSGAYDLPGLGVSPDVAGLIIIVPTVIMVVSIIAYLARDALLKQQLVNQELSAIASTTFDKNYRQTVEMRSDMDTSMWSDVDVSTDRLRPHPGSYA